MDFKTSLGIIKIKAVNLPNFKLLEFEEFKKQDFRLILKRNKGKTNVVIAQRKLIFYIYENKPKKRDRKPNIKFSVKILDSSPIYGISQLLNLFQ